MNPFIAPYLSWVEKTTQSVHNTYPASYAAKALMASAESAYVYARKIVNGPVSLDDMDSIALLCKKSRYLAVLLGSTLFDQEQGSPFAFIARPLESSLFDLGLGWLPLAIILGCEIEASTDNAERNGSFSCFIPAVDYTFKLGSAAAKILSLDDIKMVAMKKIEDNTQCSPEDLVDYLSNVAVADWDFAIADTGDALLIAQGY